MNFFYFKIANKFNIIDKPNLRSSHTRVTLRGGGVIFALGMLLFFVSSGFSYPWFIAGLFINFFNFRTKAKCFAGDVGSVSIAFMILFALGSLILQTGDLYYMGFLVLYGIN